NLIGGYLSISGGLGNKTGAKDNTVEITGGTIKKGNNNIHEHTAVNGGKSNGASGAVTGNKVIISGGTLDVPIRGGWVTNANNSAGAKNNTVTISGGTINATDIYGGLVKKAGDATGNTITIEGNPTFNGTTVLHGGGAYENEGTGDVRTGNTLNIKKSGVIVNAIENFANYNFTIPANTAPDTTMLTLADDIDLGSQSEGEGNLKLSAGGVLNLSQGSVITLIDAGVNNTISNFSNLLGEKTATATDISGVVYTYTFEVMLNDDHSKLIATVTDVGNQAPSPSTPSSPTPTEPTEPEPTEPEPTEPEPTEPEPTEPEPTEPEPTEPEPTEPEPTEPEPTTPVPGGQPEVEVVEGTDTPVVEAPITQDNITVDAAAGTETVTVPSDAITASIEALEEAIAAGEVSASDSTVQIVVPAPAATVAIEEVKVGIPVSDLKVLADSDAAENVKIVSAVGDIKLNTLALNELISQAQSVDPAANVEIVIVKGETKVTDLLGESGTAEEKQIKIEKLNEKLKDGKTRDIFDVSIFAGDTRIDEFRVTGKMTIGLPYALKSGETSNNVWVDYMDFANDTAERMVDGRDYKDGKAIFETNHLSIYAVVYDEEKRSTPSGGGGCDAGFGVFALLAAAGAAVTRKR
ncbi:MAG: hypothetical protein LBO21_03955, partial [Synergistaceae bacterium]|nr:hypothetical protein [Synergistaceae bacterium]